MYILRLTITLFKKVVHKDIIVCVLSPPKIKWVICSPKLFPRPHFVNQTHDFSTLMCFWENIRLYFTVVTCDLFLFSPTFGQVVRVLTYIYWLSALFQYKWKYTEFFIPLWIASTLTNFIFVCIKKRSSLASCHLPIHSLAHNRIYSLSFHTALTHFFPCTHKPYSRFSISFKKKSE